jgi:hypothetical protein
MSLLLTTSSYLCRSRFIRALSYQLNDFPPTHKRLLCAAINDQARQVLQESQTWFKDFQAYNHLSLATVVVASYRVLSPHIRDENRLLAILTDSFGDFYRVGGLSLWIKIQLRFSRNPYRFFLRSHKARLWFKLVFGKSFAFNVEEKNTEFTFEVRRCLYNEYLKAQNLPQLISIFCAADDQWTRLIQPDKHGVSFKRPTILANSEDMCRFRFVRTLKDNKEE